MLIARHILKWCTYVMRVRIVDQELIVWCAKVKSVRKPALAACKREKYSVNSVSTFARSVGFGIAMIVTVDAQ